MEFDESACSQAHSSTQHSVRSDGQILDSVTWYVSHCLSCELSTERALQNLVRRLKAVYVKRFSCSQVHNSNSLLHGIS